MTSLTSNGPRHPGLLAKLMAAVRPEFRDDVLVFAPDDPVFGGGRCRVPGCERHARGHGLCQGHRLRWIKKGRPDLEIFASSTDPRWHRQQPNQRCRVPGCGYGSARRGMCQLHAQRWDRAGRPDVDAWLVDPPAVKQPASGAVCRIDHCELWPQAELPFCHSHASTWKVNGRPDVDQFARRFTEESLPASEVIQLGQLGPQLRLEMQYILQCRHDERSGKLAPHIVMRVVRMLAQSQVTSMLDDDEAGWRQRGWDAFKDSLSRSLLGYAHRHVLDLAEAGGWEAEYPRDVWQMRRLGFNTARGRTIRFDGIAQSWFKELAKRWIRWRLTSGLGMEAAVRPARVITRFARFLDTIGVTDIGGIDRPVLERYLADLHTAMSGRPNHGVHIGLLDAFFAAIRQHRWDNRLPAGAMFFTEDYPKRGERLPRALAEHVMAQVEHPDNLARWDNPAYRLITIILIRCGLRVTDALRLQTDCVVTDADGAPYLRYHNHKMKRDALVPIDEELRGMLAEQRHRNTQRWPDGTTGLFPRPTKNIDGAAPVASSTYRLAMYRWLAGCDIRDEHGDPIHLTPHQARHTLGTRLINKDVPQEVVRRILDHDSSQMTGHYARLSDTTIRRHWEAAHKVNIHGQTVTLDPEGPLAEAAWAKQRVSRATQALPNGYCGLPIVQSCPHANSCLTCPMFITTPEFLPEHRAQREQTLQIITAAEARGQQRLVEMNRQVADNLDTIITALEDGDNDGEHTLGEADAS